MLAEQEIQYVCNLAEHCGKIAADMRQSVGVREKTEPHDLVTDADMALSEILLTELGKRFPNDFLISEEDVPEIIDFESRGIWYLDPIDGTDNYVSGDGQYSVMIGLLVAGKPHFGCVYAPAHGITYFGGPNYGSWVRRKGGKAQAFNPEFKQDMAPPVRLMMGSRDKRNHPWTNNIPGSKLISAGSVGLKVAKVIRDEADLFVHLSGKLKYWDTVGPVAIALAAGLEAGTLDDDEVPYPLAKIQHPQSIIIGRKGSLAWSRASMGERFFS